MTSSVAISQRHHPPSPKPLSAADRKRIAAICADPRMAEEVQRRRLGLAITPDPVATRDLRKTLATLAAKLFAAGNALETLPATARTLLQEKLGGTQAQQYDLAMTLYNVAGCAGAATMRLAPKSGRPVDPRIAYAVASADALCEAFHLIGKAPDLASLILDAEIDVEVCKRARRRVRKPT